MADFNLGSDNWPGLSKLVEELGELQQVLGKLVATNGLEQHWDGTNLARRLEEEIADVGAAIDFFVHHNDALDAFEIDERMNRKYDQFVAWHTADRVALGELPA